MVQQDAQHFWIVGACQVGNRERAHLAHKDKGGADDDVLVCQRKNDAAQNIPPGASGVARAFHIGIVDAGQRGAHHHGGKGNAEPQV